MGVENSMVAIVSGRSWTSKVLTARLDQEVLAIRLGEIDCVFVDVSSSSAGPGELGLGERASELPHLFFVGRASQSSSWIEYQGSLQDAVAIDSFARGALGKSKSLPHQASQCNDDAGLNIRHVASSDELAVSIDDVLIDAVVIFFGDDDTTGSNDHYGNFVCACSKLHDESSHVIALHASSNASLAAEHDIVNRPSVLVLKEFERVESVLSHDVLRSTTGLYDALITAIDLQTVPLVNEFSNAVASSMMHGPMKRTLLVFGDDDALSREALSANAKLHKRSLLHVHASPHEQRLMNFAGVGRDQTPTAVLFDFSEASPRKYRLFDFEDAGKDEQHLDSLLLEFTAAFFRGELPAYIKSEVPIDDSDRSLKTFVGRDFRERIEGQNVLVAFLASPQVCGFRCAQLQTTLETVAASPAIESGGIMVGTMDVMGNEIDHDGVSVRSVPTVGFFGKLGVFVEYRQIHDLEVDSLVAFAVDSSGVSVE